MSIEDKILEDWCKEAELDYKFALSLKKWIFPLLENAHIKYGSLFDRIYLEQKEGIELRQENSAKLLMLLRRINPNLLVPEEVKTLSIHLEFLPLVEGFYSGQIDYLILLLIANGQEFKPYKKRKPIFKLQEIEKIDLSIKMKFLKNNGFSDLAINEKKFRELRNSIAHMSYRIQPNLTVMTKGCDITDNDYAKLYDYLREVSYSLFNVQRLFYKKHFENLSPDDLETIKNSTLKQITCAFCGYDNLVVQRKHAIGFEPTICTNCLKVLKSKP